MAYLSPLFDCKLVVEATVSAVVATIIRLTDGAVMARRYLPPDADSVYLGNATTTGGAHYAIHYSTLTDHKPVGHRLRHTESWSWTGKLCACVVTGGV